MVYECSCINGAKVDMSDPTNAIVELPENPAVEEDSSTDSKEETEEANVVYDLGE